MYLDDIGTYLTILGVVSSGWLLQKGFLPDDQDQVIVLYEQPGTPPETQQSENQNLKLMIRVRGVKLDYQTPRNKWQDCFNALQGAQANSGFSGSLPGFTFILTEQEGPFPFEDAKGRHNFTCNFRVKKARS